MSKINYEVQCEHCGKTFVLQVNQEDLDEYYDTPRNERRLAQEIFHYLTPEDRELLMSLTCDECWKKQIGLDYDPEYDGEDDNSWNNLLGIHPEDEEVDE